MKMQSFTGISYLLLILLVQLVPAQISPKPEDATLKGITFQNVFERSLCHPMEQLLDVEQEIPGKVGCMYTPVCVPLWRCSGCCMDETLECHPTLERNITLQVMNICPLISNHLVELTFVEHQTCECRIRQPLKKSKSHRNTESINKKPRMRKHKKTPNGCGKCQLPQNN